jgi:hypothetical protein
MSAGILSLFFGHDSVMVVGVEDGPDGSLKVYIGARYQRRYVLVDDPQGQDNVRRAWGQGGHVFTQLPPNTCVFVDPAAPAPTP